MDLGGGPEVGKIREALVFPGCADFQPLLYLNGLAQAITAKHGGRIFEHSRVMQTQGKKARALWQSRELVLPHPQHCALTWDVVVPLLLLLGLSSKAVRYCVAPAAGLVQGTQSAHAAVTPTFPAGFDHGRLHRRGAQRRAGDQLAHPPQPAGALQAEALEVRALTPLSTNAWDLPVFLIHAWTVAHCRHCLHRSYVVGLRIPKVGALHCCTFTLISCAMSTASPECAAHVHLQPSCKRILRPALASSELPMVLPDPQDKVKAVQYWDTASPYHYVRTEDHPEHGLILIVGGEDHPTGMKPNEYEVGAQQHVPYTVECYHGVRTFEPAVPPAHHPYTTNRLSGNTSLHCVFLAQESAFMRQRRWAAAHIMALMTTGLQPMPVCAASGQVRKIGGLGKEQMDIRRRACF